MERGMPTAPELIFPRDFCAQLKPPKHFVSPFLVPFLLESIIWIIRCLAFSKYGSVLEISSYSPFLIWTCVSSKEMTVNWLLFCEWCFPKFLHIYWQIKDWNWGGLIPLAWFHTVYRWYCLATNPMFREYFPSVDMPLRQKIKRLKNTRQFQESNFFVVLLLTPLAVLKVNYTFS